MGLFRRKGLSGRRLQSKNSVKNPNATYGNIGLNSAAARRMRRQNPVFKITSKVKGLAGRLSLSNFRPQASLSNKLSGEKGQYKRRYSFIFKFFRLFLRQYKILINILLLAAGAGFLYLILQTDYFQVKEIRFEGIEQTERSKLEEIAAKYKGKNIYTLNLDKFEEDVSGLSVYIKEVHAEKYLPSKIVVKVTERYPKVVYVNFNGVLLIDKDNYVVASPINQSINFTDEEWKAYYSQDVNLKIVQERVQVNLEQESVDGEQEQEQVEEQEQGEDQEEFDYSKIEDKVKREALDEIKTEMTQIIKAHFTSLNEQINTSEYAGLQRIYLYDDADYKEGDVINDKTLTYTTQVIEHFDRQEELTIKEIIWESRFSLTIHTLEEKIFVFGTNREIDDQLDDLDVVLSELQANHQDYKKIDLRAEIIGVK